MTEKQPDGPDLGQILGRGGDDVRSRLGAPDSETTVGTDVWLVFSRPGWKVRVRLSASATGPTVRSWTCEPALPFDDLDLAVHAVGLRVRGEGDAPADSDGRLLRAVVEDEPVPASLTARVVDGRIASLTVFDEAPDWRGEGA